MSPTAHTFHLIGQQKKKGVKLFLCLGDSPNDVAEVTKGVAMIGFEFR